MDTCQRLAGGEAGKRGNLTEGPEKASTGLVLQQEEEPALDDYSRGRGQLCGDPERPVRVACPKVKEKDAAPGWWPEGEMRGPGHGPWGQV